MQGGKHELERYFQGDKFVVTDSNAHPYFESPHYSRRGDSKVPLLPFARPADQDSPLWVEIHSCSTVLDANTDSIRGYSCPPSQKRWLILFESKGN